MSIIVSKFGGSSTANAEMFLKLRDIVSGQHDRRYIVLSAPGTGEGCPDKITNLLYMYYELHASCKDASPVLEKICLRFSAITSALSLPDIAPLVSSEIRHAAGISADFTASRGEYFCALIFSRWLKIPMADAADLIHFRNDGSLDEKRTFRAIAAMKAMHPRAVVPGFYGSMPDGSIHTFPRNGSDITGALIAAGTGADLYENWSDVDGFMTADPAIVPDARFNPNISYRQMRLLAREGAQILHPDSLLPVSTANIPTLLKNTKRPEGAGTLISDDFTSVVPCVTGRKDLVCIPLDHPAMRRLPENTPYRCHEDHTGRIFMLVGKQSLPDDFAIFDNCACISAFGMPDESKDDILRIVRPIRYFSEEDHFKLIVPVEDYECCLRSVHSLLLKH